MAGEDGWSVAHDVEYARHDGIALGGSLWRPHAAGPTPAIVAIHGGGWQSGSPETYRHWGPWLAARGFALFAIRYRFSRPGCKAWPECLHDARAAVQFLKGRAAELAIDPGRISMMGDSAGGHLSALVALAGDHPAFAGRYPDDPFAHLPTRVRCVIGAYGVYDLAAQWLHDQPIRPGDHIVERLMGFPPMEDRRAYFDASPMSYVERRNAGPSFLLVHGTEDDVVDRAQTDAFHFALRLAGFYTRRLIAGAAGHYFMHEAMDVPASVAGWLAPRALRFLKERG
jgi:acetyl esterase/lipase